MHQVLKIILYVFILEELISSVICQKCISRKYNQASFVCVCNGTYCDKFPEIQTPASGHYILYTSSAQGLRFEKSIGEFNKFLKQPEQCISISYNNVSHDFVGFGGSFSDAAGINIVSLSKSAQQLLMESYFGSRGLEYVLGRVPVAGTDYSTRPYTYDKGLRIGLLDDFPDPHLINFSLAPEDYKYKIPLIQQAQSIAGQPLKLVASVWSAPPWMKTNGKINGVGFLKIQYYGTLVQYMIKFLENYNKFGINFWCFTTGNEPISTLSVGINSLGWTPNTQAEWISNNLGPMLKSSPFNDVCILLYDDTRPVAPFWVDTVMANPLARKYVDGVGIHWYLDDISSPTEITDMFVKYPELILLNTESCAGFKNQTGGPLLGSWDRANEYAFEIIQNFGFGERGWIDWNLALSTDGGPNWRKARGDAAIIVNKTANEFYKQPVYYALAHFSKFITPGSHLLLNVHDVLTIGKVLSVRRQDGSVAVFVVNTQKHDITINVFDERHGLASVNVPAESINTLHYS